MYSAYHSGHGYFMHMIASVIIHALVYGTIWKILHTLSIPEAVSITAVVIVLGYMLTRSTRRE